MPKKRNILKNIGIVIMALIAVAVLVIFPLFLTAEMDRQSQTFLSEISTKNAHAMDLEFRQQASYLLSLKREVNSDNLDDPKATLLSIAETPTTVEYKRYGVATLDGRAYTSDGKEVKLSTTAHIDECVKNNGLTVYKLTTEESIDKDSVFMMMLPLKDKNGTKAVIFLSFSTEAFEKKFDSSAFEGTEFFFIVDANGKNIMSTHEKAQFHDISNLFSSSQYDPKYNGSRLEVLKQDMKNLKSGVLLPTESANFYLSYAPIYFNGWYLFSIVPAGNVDANRNTVLTYVIFMCLLLAIIFSVLTSYVVFMERRKKDELDKILYTDSLTGGPSYAKFCLDVKQQLVKGQKAAYIVMDLDNFKLINDYYSYEIGNKTINLIYYIWNDMLEDNEYVGRIAADRFAVYLKCSSEEQLMKRLDNFCELCRSHNDKNLGSYIITPSIGVYLINEKNVNIQQMQNSAVMAKALVKGDHETMVAVYNSNLRKEMSDRKTLEDELEHAIQDRVFSLMFQPQFDTQTKKLCGAEALIRWQKEDGTYVPPSKFIPIAEDRGFIKDLDRLVFEMACDAQKTFADNNNIIDISVNVSQQSLYDPNFIDKYVEIAKEKNADISHIHLEITESTLFENHKMFIKLLRKLRRLGFKIHMDDFGTGYSSIMLLKSMPIDFLKLDKSFVDDYNDPRGRSIIECIITMAKQLGVILIAEGVETEDQYLYIKEQGCEITQGFYFSKPITFEEIENLLKD